MNTVLASLVTDPSIINKYVDVDAAYGPQCWDLVELYAERLGVPKEPWAIPLGPLGAAKEAWTTFDSNPHMQKYFTKIPKDQGQSGDIAVYDGHGAYTEGHIAILVDPTTVLEQNADPDESPVHLAKRATTYLLGYLRFNAKEAKQGEEPMTPEGVTLAYQLLVFRNPTQEELSAGVGQQWYDLETQIDQTEERQKLVGKIRDYDHLYGTATGLQEQLRVAVESNDTTAAQKIQAIKKILS